MKVVDFYYKYFDGELLNIRIGMEGILRIIQVNVFILKIMKLKIEKDKVYFRLYSYWWFKLKYSSSFLVLRLIVFLI